MNQNSFEEDSKLPLTQNNQYVPLTARPSELSSKYEPLSLSTNEAHGADS
jgi:hypothetical protein